MILLIGDYIRDIYHFCEAPRLCPEAPVPILIEQSTSETDGGASLVAAQLNELIQPGDHVLPLFGSESQKHRYFADGHLVCRIDRDSYAFPKTGTLKNILDGLENKPELLIVSDYSKDALNAPVAGHIMRTAAAGKIPVFVDAKHHWDWYKGAEAFFPNTHEIVPHPKYAKHIIQKLGPLGCSVDGQRVPLINPQEARDITGAGDIFLAAFAAKYVKRTKDLIACAEFANKIASESVKYIGTHVVRGVSID